MYFCKEISILVVNNSYLAKYVQISFVLLSNYILICDILNYFKLLIIFAYFYI